MALLVVTRGSLAIHSFSVSHNNVASNIEFQMVSRLCGLEESRYSLHCLQNAKANLFQLKEDYTPNLLIRVLGNNNIGVNLIY